MIAEETEIPAGVVNVVTSTDHSLGAQLCSDPRVDLVSFTGSTATGRTVMATAAQTLKKVFLELGGKSAFIVLERCGHQRCMLGCRVLSVCVHAGQGCALSTRLLVPRARYDDALAAASAAMAGIRAGDHQRARKRCVARSSRRAQRARVGELPRPRGSKRAARS